MKSFLNQKSIAREIPLSRAGFFTNWSAPGRPPCQAAAIVSAEARAASQTLMDQVREMRYDTRGYAASVLGPACGSMVSTISIVRMECHSNLPVRATRSTSSRVVDFRVRPLAIVS